jgi:hypothetical protein
MSSPVIERFFPAVVQNPAVGRIVIFVQPATEQPVNGTREHPAIITRVWNDGLVNLQVFYDAAPVEARTSVGPYDVEAPDGWGWRWPERTA